MSNLNSSIGQQCISKSGDSEPQAVHCGAIISKYSRAAAILSREKKGYGSQKQGSNISRTPDIVKRNIFGMSKSRHVNRPLILDKSIWGFYYALEAHGEELQSEVR